MNRAEPGPKEGYHAYRLTRRRDSQTRPESPKRGVPCAEGLTGKESMSRRRRGGRSMRRSIPLKPDNVCRQLMSSKTSVIEPGSVPEVVCSRIACAECRWKLGVGGTVPRRSSKSRSRVPAPEKTRPEGHLRRREVGIAPVEPTASRLLAASTATGSRPKRPDLRFIRRRRQKGRHVAGSKTNAGLAELHARPRVR